MGLVRGRVTSADASPKAADGLITFSVMWALALVFSTVSHTSILLFEQGLKLALLEYAILAIALALLVQPRRIVLLLCLAGAMVLQYLYRLPVPSNNQTIAFFMNLAIVAAILLAWSRQNTAEDARDSIYESLRMVARLLLATMYFYGIFHKINTDFLDPNTSCAVALYGPLTRSFGLEENLIGQYGAIIATFVLEGIAIVSLFWRRYFAIGLIVALWFHYMIPISAYSWYMDFSSLVFALYTLSVPREVSVAFYARTSGLLRKLPLPSAGVAATLALGVGIVAFFALATYLRLRAGDTIVTDQMVWHSTWMVLWAIIGGVAMVLLTWAALEALPYRPQGLPPAPKWVYVLASVLFLSCLSPYLGLKTESSVAMFSNLHTEGGTTNHLLFGSPPYIADYQQEVAMLTGSSNPGMQDRARLGLGMVRYDLERWMRKHPDEWVSFAMNGQNFERANAATFPIQDYNLVERKLLVFKPVDFARPKVCTH
jgi:hypothetical protein